MSKAKYTTIRDAMRVLIETGSLSESLQVTLRTEHGGFIDLDVTDVSLSGVVFAEPDQSRILDYDIAGISDVAALMLGMCSDDLPQEDQMSKQDLKALEALEQAASTFLHSRGAVVGWKDIQSK